MYNSLLEKIFSAYPMYHRLGSAAYKEGLENIEMLAQFTGNPQNSFKSIHVAGTNGKGSVAHLLASYFQEAGLKTGLFTSPHLVDFRERIKINGISISEKQVLDFFETYQKKIDLIAPSFFEITTVLAFDFFAKSHVDIAIIEAGLGGRLDATNIITPELSVITNISLEHTKMLGTTISEIAYEKAGIIKNNVPVVIGEYNEEAYPVFKKRATEQYAPFFLANNSVNVMFEDDITGERYISIYYNSQLILEKVKLPLLGNYQLKNIATFVQTIALMGDIFSDARNILKRSIENVISNTDFLGRWQVISNKPLTVCDAAHNPAGIKEIANQLKKQNYKHLHFIIGFVNDKDIEAILTLLPHEKCSYYVCQPDIERALDAHLLNEKMQHLNFNTCLATTVENAYDMAKIAANEDDMIFVGGSCFVVGDFLKSIDYKKKRLPI